jgi:hypothetical protein
MECDKYLNSNTLMQLAYREGLDTVTVRSAAVREKHTSGI